MRGSIIDAAGIKVEDKRGLPYDIQFALKLCSQFSMMAQVYACCQLMDHISSMPEEKGNSLWSMFAPPALLMLE